VLEGCIDRQVGLGVRGHAYLGEQLNELTPTQWDRMPTCLHSTLIMSPQCLYSYTLRHVSTTTCFGPFFLAVIKYIKLFLHSPFFSGLLVSDYMFTLRYRFSLWCRNTPTFYSSNKAYLVVTRCHTEHRLTVLPRLCKILTFKRFSWG
jgi:hypothetical protein